MKKMFIMLMIAFLILVGGCANGPKNVSLTPTSLPQIEEGIIIMAYDKPADFAYFEVYVSTTSSFNPKGWNGSAWAGEPNDPADWDGSADYNLHTRTANEPITMTTKLIPYTLYYVRVVAVDTSGNRSDPGAEVNARAGDKQRASTLVVAASDAAAASKAGADYVCDGTDDESEINTALTALPQIVIEGGTAQAGAASTVTLRSTAGDVDDMYNGLVIFITGGLGSGQSKTITDYVGSTKVATVDSAWATNPNNTSTYEIRSRVGKVLLTEGTFTVNASIVLYSNTTLEGLGDGTIVKIKDSKTGDLDVISNSDITNGNFNVRCKNFSINGNRANVTSGTHRGIYFYKAQDCLIDKLNIFKLNSEGIALSESQKCQVLNSRSEYNGRGIYVSSSAWASYAKLLGNKLTGNYFNNNDYQGIYFANQDSGTINLNEVSYNGREGVLCFIAKEIGIIGNTCIANGQETDNTYSNIQLSGNPLGVSSDRNKIQNNTCRKGSLTNKSKYGIYTAAATSNTIISENSCYTGGSTSGIAGVSVQLYGNNENNNGTYNSTPN